MIFSQEIVDICKEPKSLEDRVLEAKRNIVLTYHGYPEDVSDSTETVERKFNVMFSTQNRNPDGETRSFPIEDDMPGRSDSTITWNSDVMCMMFASDESILPCTIYTKYNNDDMAWNGMAPLDIAKKAVGW